MTHPLAEATRAASETWKSHFNSGNAAGCAACYEADAVMVAAPFGTFTGRDEIEAFWVKLVEDGFCDVEYLDPQIEVIDDSTAVLRTRWTMNKAQGEITRELWVLQPDGTLLLREDHFEAQG